MSNFAMKKFPSVGNMRKYTKNKNTGNITEELNSILKRMKLSDTYSIIVPDMSKECLKFLKSKGYSIKNPTLLVSGKYYCKVSWELKGDR